MTLDLVDMFRRHGYEEASCFGHALEGNLHLVFAQVLSLPHPLPPMGGFHSSICVCLHVYVQVCVYV